MSMGKVARFMGGMVAAVAAFGLAVSAQVRYRTSALGACTRWITSCVDPTSRSLDDCARSAPPCATAQPWEEPDCCPAIYLSSSIRPMS